MSNTEQDGNGRAISPGVRSLLADAIKAEITPEYLRELIASVKTLTKQVFVWCPNCREQVSVTMPDLPRMVANLTALLEQAEGKPRTVAAEDSNVTLIIERNFPTRERESPAA